MNNNKFISITTISAGLPITLYANDLENRLVAATPAMQWKYNETDRWTSYSDETPDLTGNKTVIVKMGATGVHIEADESTATTFSFTPAAGIYSKAVKFLTSSNLITINLSLSVPVQCQPVVLSLPHRMKFEMLEMWNVSGH